jgi:ketosteroid isomerase-like protein
VSDLDKQISHVMRAYAAAVFAKDAESFMHLYHPAVRVFDAWGVWLYEDAASWRTAVEGWFSSLGGERVKVSFAEVQTFGAPALATVSAIVTYAAEDAQGEALRSMQNRITWVLREAGHVLRIVHEHTSAPIGFEDGKAILTRTTQR